MRRFPRHQLLTVKDVPAMPAGTATVYRVEDIEKGHSSLAVLDENGVLRTYDRDRHPFDADKCRVSEVVE